MKRILRAALLIGAVLLLLLLTVPLLIPVPSLTGVAPPQQIADPDSEFLEVNGVRLHVKRSGQGQPAMILLHGFGSHTETWRLVRPTLSTLGQVIAFDRPGFGLTERPLAWTGANPYSPDAQIELVIGLMDQLGIEQAILIGNSAGGTISAQAALRHPTRVAALVLVSPAIYTGGGTPAFLRPLFDTPQMRRIGPLLARAQAQNIESLLPSAYHDPAKVTAEMLSFYQRPLQVENWDRGFYEFLAASRTPSSLSEDVKTLALPVLVVTGEFDDWVPTAQSIRLSTEIPNAQQAVLPNCGHVPQEECPDAFLQPVVPFVSSLTNR